jgi:membrane associated rhomboid family serine protease
MTRFPWLTGVVFTITAISNLTQFAVHGTLAHLERSPAGLHGDWWRTATALFVQDGGVVGTLSNLAFLVALGAVAEQAISRPRWLICYFGAGLVGELSGYAWQPHGGGNSIAVCGLAGAIAVALWRHDDRLPIFAPAPVLFWCGALLSGLWYPLLIVGLAAGVLSRPAADRGLPTQRVTAAATLITGAVVAASEDIHGAALLAGLAIAALLTLAHPQPDPTA